MLGLCNPFGFAQGPEPFGSRSGSRDERRGRSIAPPRTRGAGGFETRPYIRAGKLIRGTESLVARLSARLEAHRLTITQFGALEALFHLGPLCQRELGEKLLRSGGNITMLVDNLERRGWVRRERQGQDRRRILVHLTREGRKRIARIVPAHVAAIVREMSRLSVREQAELRRICRKLGRGEKANE